MSNNCLKSLDLLLFYVFILCKLIVFFDVPYCFSVDVVLCCIDVYCCSVFYCKVVPILQYSVVVVYSSSSDIQSYLYSSKNRFLQIPFPANLPHAVGQLSLILLPRYEYFLLLHRILRIFNVFPVLTQLHFFFLPFLLTYTTFFEFFGQTGGFGVGGGWDTGAGVGLWTGNDVGRSDGWDVGAFVGGGVAFVGWDFLDCNARRWRPATSLLKTDGMVHQITNKTTAAWMLMM